MEPGSNIISTFAPTNEHGQSKESKCILGIVLGGRKKERQSRATPDLVIKCQEVSGTTSLRGRQTQSATSGPLLSERWGGGGVAASVDSVIS